MTKYMMLIYAPTDPAQADAAGTDIERWIAYDAMLKAAGVHVSDHRLHGPETATTVRVRGGDTVISDGPFADTKEYLAGYYVIDAGDLDAAIALAAQVPLSHYGSVELRPIIPTTGVPEE